MKKRPPLYPIGDREPINEPILPNDPGDILKEVI